MDGDDNRLSTTALAKKLNIPVQQLFATLKDYGWIQRASDTWALTSKGEFEGGSYQQSRRFGRYIVWPERLDHHPLLDRQHGFHIRPRPACGCEGRRSFRHGLLR